MRRAVEPPFAVGALAVLVFAIWFAKDAGYAPATWYTGGLFLVMQFPRFDKVFTKLRAWELVEFDKVVLLDADMVVLKTIDELFDRPELSAAPDFLLPDRFNSGTLVLEPSRHKLTRQPPFFSCGPPRGSTHF